jgi:hypothetical protein
MDPSKQIAATHERFAADEKNVPGSERQFGIVMALGLTLLSALNFWRTGSWWPWSTLKPLNLAWFKFGLLLHRVINPLVMAVVYYASVVPTGLIMRAMGKDMLRLKLEPDAETYWMARQPPGPAAETMKDQF